MLKKKTIKNIEQAIQNVKNSKTTTRKGEVANRKLINALKSLFDKK